MFAQSQNVSPNYHRADWEHCTCKPHFRFFVSFLSVQLCHFLSQWTLLSLDKVNVHVLSYWTLLINGWYFVWTSIIMKQTMHINREYNKLHLSRPNWFNNSIKKIVCSDIHMFMNKMIILVKVHCITCLLINFERMDIDIFIDNEVGCH